MGVHRDLAARSDADVGDIRRSLSPAAEAQFLELAQHDEGKAVVDLREVEIGGRQPQLSEHPGGGLLQSEIKDVGPARQVVGDIRVALAAAEDEHVALAGVRRRRGRLDQHRRGAVGLQADVIEPERLDDEGRSVVLLRRQRAPGEIRLRVPVRVGAGGERDGAQPGRIGARLIQPAVRLQAVPLHRDHQAVRMLQMGPEVLARPGETRGGAVSPAEPSPAVLGAAGRDDHPAGPAGRHRRDRDHDGRHRAGSAQEIGRGKTQVGDSQPADIGLGRDLSAGDHDAVDGRRVDRRVGARSPGGLNEQVLGALGGAADELRFTDAGELRDRLVHDRPPLSLTQPRKACPSTASYCARTAMPQARSDGSAPR